MMPGNRLVTLERRVMQIQDAEERTRLRTLADDMAAKEGWDPDEFWADVEDIARRAEQLKWRHPEMVVDGKIDYELLERVVVEQQVFGD